MPRVPWSARLRPRHNGGMDAHLCTPLGFLETPFPDKFGIPRQPGLAPHALGTLRLQAPFDRPEAVRGLEAFSHVWLTWVFHECRGKWQPTVRPPRLGGNARVGVFASRSPFRPNGLGLSLVELAGVETSEGVVLRFRGVDLVDGTPILDVKPYLPYCESVPEARAGYVDGAPPRLDVRWTEAALADLARSRRRDLKALVEEVLAQDPRPAYAEDPERIFGLRLFDRDVKWRVEAGVAWVVGLPVFAG